MKYILQLSHKWLGSVNLCVQICCTEDILVHQNIFFLDKLQGTMSESNKILIVL